MHSTWRRGIVAVAFVVLIGATLYSLLSASFAIGRADEERHYRIVSDIRALSCQIDTYRSRGGALPATLASLKEAPKDPWGSTYVYRNPGVHNRNDYDLFSAGPDKRPDTPDDDWGEQ